MVDIIVAGLTAGLIATAAMTVFQLPITGGGAGSTAVLAAKLSGREPADTSSQIVGWVIHAVYGVFWGVAFAWGMDAWLGASAVGVWALVGWGIALGVGLFFVSQTLVTPLVGMTQEMQETPTAEKMKMGAVYLGLHVLYGGVLGLALWPMDLESRAPELGLAVPVAAAALLIAAVVAGLVWQRVQLSSSTSARA